MPLNTQLGMKTESTYGTGVVVDTFFEFESESIVPEVQLIAPQVMRTTTRTVRYDRFVRGITGHAGSVKLPVMTTRPSRSPSIPSRLERGITRISSSARGSLIAGWSHGPRTPPNVTRCALWGVLSDVR